MTSIHDDGGLETRYVGVSQLHNNRPIADFFHRPVSSKNEAQRVADMGSVLADDSGESYAYVEREAVSLEPDTATHVPVLSLDPVHSRRGELVESVQRLLPTFFLCKAI